MIVYRHLLLAKEVQLGYCVSEQD